MNIDEQIAAITKDGKSSWLIITGNRFDFDPLRNHNGCPLGLGHRKPMDRFALQVDGFTTIDAEIMLDDTIRILYNGCREQHYAEDDAFMGDEFLPGKAVDWLTFRRALRRYVEMSWRRVNPLYEVYWDTQLVGE